ncbi:hypothetical protein HYFRA_00002224 [Hymenoscyphus fraxineus]|uniref:Nephrocystin 3-like N-terminal domain-containing protein n=1 Tax=Hymenoscyphus fraxineus TaxID=746836 RepID=A0A9N9KN89_9HELO|nr:hypothetical protein HYFRA_00002224 [Hymenoscyphus fraxineus]
MAPNPHPNGCGIHVGQSSRLEEGNIEQSSPDELDQYLEEILLLILNVGTKLLSIKRHRIPQTRLSPASYFDSYSLSKESAIPNAISKFIIPQSKIHSGSWKMESLMSEPLMKRASTLPTKFMETKAVNLHGAYRNTSSHYDQKKKEYVLSRKEDDVVDIETVAREKEAEKQTAHFRTIIVAFSEANSLPKNLKGFDIRGAHDWDEVLETVDSAKAAYGDKAKGKKGIHIRAGRGISNRANNLSPWLELLPDGDYSSIICGGLKLVFGAAAAQANVRNKIMEAIETLPEEIEEANDTLERFRGVGDYKADQKLRKLSLELYLSILSAIEGMLKWLDEPAFKKIMKSLARQSSYGDDVGDSIRMVARRSQLFRRAAKALAQAVGVEALEVARETKSLTDQSFTMGAMNYALAEDIYKQGERSHSSLQDAIKDGLASVAKTGTHSILEEGLDAFLSLATKSEWLNNMYHHKIDHLGKMLEAIQQSQMSQLLLNQKQFLQPAAPQNNINRVMLQNILAININMTNDSLEKTISIGRTEEENTHGLTEKLMENRQFRNWFQCSGSKLLLLRAVATENISPLSNFCAMLVKSLKNVQPAITLHYFTSVHRVLRGTDIEHGQHLLRSLIAQLLQHWPDGHLLPSNLDLSGISNHDFESLWLLFVAAVTSFEGATIFCTLDGLLRYPREEEALVLVHRLWELSEALQTVTLKVLITSPIPPRLRDVVPANNQVIIDTDTSDRTDSNVGNGLSPTVTRQFTRGRSGSPFRREPLNIL